VQHNAVAQTNTLIHHRKRLCNLSHLKIKYSAVLDACPRSFRHPWTMHHIGLALPQVSFLGTTGRGAAAAEPWPSRIYDTTGGPGLWPCLAQSDWDAMTDCLACLGLPLGLVVASWFFDGRGLTSRDAWPTPDDAALSLVKDQTSMMAALVCSL